MFFIFLTKREKSKEHVFYETLERRAELTRGEQKRKNALVQGYAGEVAYDALFDEVGHHNLFIFRDLWLKIESATLQIDTLIVTEEKLIVNEIKNYSGVYKYEQGSWTVNGYQIPEDPLAQASRTANKLLKLRAHTPHRIEVEKKVVFTNPNFHLMPVTEENKRHLVERSLLQRYLTGITQMHSGRRADEISSTIQTFMIDDPMPKPEVDADRIRCGLYCGRCGAFDVAVGKYRSQCNACGHRETLERQVVRTITDFAILFPEQPIDRRGITWLAGNLLKSRSIGHNLQKYCTLTNRGRHSAYTVETTDADALLEIKGYASKYERFKA